MKKFTASTQKAPNQLFSRENETSIRKESDIRSAVSPEKLYQEIKTLIFGNEFEDKDQSQIARQLQTEILPSLKDNEDLKTNYRSMEFDYNDENGFTHTGLNFLHLLITELDHEHLTFELLKQAAEATGLQLSDKTVEDMNLLDFYIMIHDEKADQTKAANDLTKHKEFKLRSELFLTILMENPSDPFSFDENKENYLVLPIQQAPDFVKLIELTKPPISIRETLKLPKTVETYSKIVWLEKRLTGEAT